MIAKNKERLILTLDKEIIRRIEEKSKEKKTTKSKYLTEILEFILVKN